MADSDGDDKPTQRQAGGVSRGKDDKERWSAEQKTYIYEKWMSRTDTGAKGAARSWFAQLREDGIKDGMWDVSKTVNSNTIRGIVGTLSRRARGEPARPSARRKASVEPISTPPSPHSAIIEPTRKSGRIAVRGSKNYAELENNIDAIDSAMDRDEDDLDDEDELQADQMMDGAMLPARSQINRLADEGDLDGLDSFDEEFYRRKPTKRERASETRDGNYDEGESKSKRGGGGARNGLANGNGHHHPSDEKEPRDYKALHTDVERLDSQLSDCRKDTMTIAGKVDLLLSFVNQIAAKLAVPVDTLNTSVAGSEKSTASSSCSSTSSSAAGSGVDAPLPVAKQLPVAMNAEPNNAMATTATASLKEQ